MKLGLEVARVLMRSGSYRLNRDILLLMLSLLIKVCNESPYVGNEETI